MKTTPGQSPGVVFRIHFFIPVKIARVPAAMLAPLTMSKEVTSSQKQGA